MGSKRTDQRQARALELYRKGLSARDVADLLQVSPSTVLRWIGGQRRTKEQAWEVSAYRSFSPRKCRERARMKMERHLRRTLRTNEHVHHIDGDYTNNRLDNLEVLPAKEHARLHGVKRYRGQGTLGKGRNRDEVPF